MDSPLLLVLLLVVVFLSCGGCEVYYVHSNFPNATPCPVEASPCLTLQQYVNKASRYLPKNMSNVEFRFLSGKHLLSKPFNVEGSSNITLRSDNIVSVWDHIDVVIHCKKYSYFQFSQTATVSISGLSLNECSSSDDDSMGALTFNFATNVSIHDIEFTDSFQNDVLANNVYGVFNVTNTSSSSRKIHMNSLNIFFEIDVATTACHIKLSSLLTQSISAFIADYINTGSSVAMQNVTTGLEKYNYCGSKDSVFGAQCFSVDVMASASLVIQGCTFSAAVMLFTSQSISITDTSMSDFQTGLSIIISPSFIGVPARSAVQQKLHDYPKPEGHVQNIDVLVSNCTFRKGVGDKVKTSGSSGALIITQNQYEADVHSNVTLKNLVFEDNNSTTSFNTISSVVSLEHLPDVTIEGVNFTNNRGIPLLLVNTTIHLYGENYFIGNRALEGGGMAFMDGSFLVLHKNMLLVFRDNYADNVGGAWYVSGEDLGLLSFGAIFIDLSPICFIKISPPPVSVEDLAKFNISVQFINNSALNGGSALYGGDIGFCEIDGSEDIRGADLLVQESVFTYEPKNDSSRLSSASTRVCLCEQEIYNCTQIFSHVDGIYPGQSFSISVVAVGHHFGVVNGTVYGELVPLPNQYSSDLDSLQKSQVVGQPKCTTLSYFIRSKNPMEIVALTTRDLPVAQIVNVDIDIDTYTGNGFITQLLLTAPVYVNVSLLDCPAGFILAEEPPQCVCAPIIDKYNLTCDINIDNGTIERSGDVWVGFLTSNETTSQDGVVVSLNCPNGYCKTGTQHMNLEDPDSQCNFNRSGILCGGCPSGLSVVLGSNQCLKCSNIYITLLIPFAVCGVLLVLFIQALDLTVAVGTINGLIFYANILKTYESLFFVPGQTNILIVFISWLNLDLGIETCFFNGMDGYIKTWLQYAFPLYIWTLAGLIVLLSHYTTWLSANNSVPVLATMFLLSYNKLFRTVVTASSFVTVDVPGSSLLTAWKFDGNLAFLDVKHVILFVTSLLVFIFAWLPYTLVLLFYQFLLRVNHKRGCRWVFHLKPFFDANLGPLKDKHRYWVGVMFLARAVLLVILVASGNSSDSALISVVIVSTFLVLYSGSFTGHVYKSWVLSLLENSFFVNLNILCVATYYVKLSDSNQAPVIYTSISIVFLEFIGIVCYHCYRRALSLYLKYRGNRCDYEEIEGEEEPRREVVPVTRTEVIIGSTESHMSLREPLCEDS